MATLPRGNCAAGTLAEGRPVPNPHHTIRFTRRSRCRATVPSVAFRLASKTTSFRRNLFDRRPPKCRKGRSRTATGFGPAWGGMGNGRTALLNGDIPSVTRVSPGVRV